MATPIGAKVQIPDGRIGTYVGALHSPYNDTVIWVDVDGRQHSYAAHQLHVIDDVDDVDDVDLATRRRGDADAQQRPTAES